LYNYIRQRERLDRDWAKNILHGEEGRQSPWREGDIKVRRYEPQPAL